MNPDQIEAELIAKIEIFFPAKHRKKYVEMVRSAYAEIERLRAHVDDLQSGMYVNCVYCGFRYGPGETTPVSMADALKAHVEQCPEHPMSKLKQENKRLRALLNHYKPEGYPLE